MRRQHYRPRRDQRALVEEALAAFSSDYRYAVQMAEDAQIIQARKAGDKSRTVWAKRAKEAAGEI